MSSISMVFFSFATKTCVRQPEGPDLEFKRGGHPREDFTLCVGIKYRAGSKKQHSLFSG